MILNPTIILYYVSVTANFVLFYIKNILNTSNHPLSFAFGHQLKGIFRQLDHKKKKWKNYFTKFYLHTQRTYYRKEKGN